MTIQDVAQHLKMSWHTIKEIDKAYLKRHYSKPRLKDVEYIAIDEFAYKKGRKYKTVVYDLTEGRAIFIGEGRTSETLNPFWKKIRSSGAKLKAVSTDMCRAYWGSVLKNSPGAALVFDLFHIVKLYNTSLDDIRIMLYHQEKNIHKRQVIRSSKWVVLKNKENLSTDIKKEGKPSEVRQLQIALKVNEPLATAYYLKEELKEIWRQDDKKSAGLELEKWVSKARSTGIRQLIKFAKTVETHKDGILSWYDYPISTGPLEGFNNKIKVLKRKAYGYRDDDYFALKILSLHETRYALLR
jgi:transposase